MTESDEVRSDEQQRQYRIASARVAEIIAIEGRAAYDRADAWARSAKGTPYGGTEPVVEVKDQGRAPEQLDPQVDGKAARKDMIHAANQSST